MITIVLAYTCIVPFKLISIFQMAKTRTMAKSAIQPAAIRKYSWQMALLSIALLCLSWLHSQSLFYAILLLTQLLYPSATHKMILMCEFYLFHAFENIIYQIILLLLFRRNFFFLFISMQAKRIFAWDVKVFWTPFWCMANVGACRRRPLINLTKCIHFERTFFFSSHGLIFQGQFQSILLSPFSKLWIEFESKKIRIGVGCTTSII